MDDKIERIVDAAVFSATHHEGQKRKYTGEDYFYHPLRVSAIVGKRSSVDTIIAALLHDVVEDCDITLEEIEKNFGDEVANIVKYCTKIAVEGNRKERKKIDHEFWASGPAEAQTIKVADMIDNLPSTKEYDPEFYKVLREEKLELLNMLTKADPILIETAREILES